MNISIVGAGRAGSSFASALELVGHDVELVHHDDLSSIGDSALVILCVPTTPSRTSPRRSFHAKSASSRTSRARAILTSSRRITSRVTASLDGPAVGSDAERLIGATYCVAGDQLVLEVALSLAGRVITLDDDQRTIYHAAAVVASNHLTALMGQVRTLAESIGLTLEDFLPLSQQSLVDVARFGPDDALTGPASRGDMATIDAHLAAIPESERSSYVALANAAFELSELRRSQTPA